jgi:hypothetical protein
MNEQRVIAKLASAGRAGGPPEIDVAALVISRLAAPRPPSRAMLWAATGVSAVLAMAATLVALLAWQVRQDPFGDFMQSMVAVIR